MTLCSATRGLGCVAIRDPMHYLAVSTPRMKCVLNLTKHATAVHFAQPGRVAVMVGPNRLDSDEKGGRVGGENAPRQGSY
jgi:hypothetical protein